MNAREFIDQNSYDISAAKAERVRADIILAQCVGKPIRKIVPADFADKQSVSFEVWNSRRKQS